MTKKIAYIVSRFPTVSETFILYEIIELQKLGAEIDIFPLVHQKGSVMHAEVETLATRVHYIQKFSVGLIRDHFYWLYKDPKTYIRTLVRALVQNLPSIKFLSRAVVVILFSAHVARKIQELNTELIHAHSATHPTLMAYIIRGLTGIQYGFTAHSSDIYFNQTMLGEKIDQASFVVTISEYNRQFLQNMYPKIPAGKIKVIHCGIDPTKFPERTIHPPSNSFTLICVARLEKIKGHKYLIEACALLKAQNVDFRCLLVGNGDLQPQIHQQIKQLNLIHTVEILGFQPHQRVIELLKQANVLVLPSLSEGIPVSAMEGMAMALPVVATSVSGVPELIEDSVSGLLAPPQNSVALAEAILKLYRSPELRMQLGKIGRKKVIEEFNLRRSVTMLYSVFQEVQSRTSEYHLHARTIEL